MRDQQGLTFIEMIIALGIVVILTVAALPSLLSFYQEQRVVGAAQTLYYALQEARSEAVKANQTVYVTFSATDPWCYGVNAGSACSCRTPSSCSLGTGGAPGTQQITFSATGLSSNSLIFEGSRGALSSGSSSVLTLTVYNQSTAMGIKISLLGNLQICSDQVAGYQTCS
jgi:prepilin-type N-terminal cleavage/methylation domain-containing protein